MGGSPSPWINLIVVFSLYMSFNTYHYNILSYITTFKLPPVFELNNLEEEGASAIFFF